MNRKKTKIKALGLIVTTLFIISVVVILPSIVAAATWTQQTGSGNRGWQDIASSSDGSHLAAVDYDGQAIYISSNYGTTWTNRTPSGGPRVHENIASSSDGSFLVTGVVGEYIYTSSDYGANWTQRTGSGTHRWNSVAVSSNGQYIIAGSDTDDYIYTSSDYGANWTQRTGPGTNYWTGVDISSDGSRMVASSNAGGNSSYIYTSSDYGANWTQRTSAGQRDWRSIASNSDGSKIAAVAFNGYIYTSSDYGVSWTERTSSGSRTWIDVDISSDGSRLSAAAINSYIYLSTDSGANWTSQNAAGSRTWLAIAGSDDGNHYAAVPYSTYIWVMGAPSAPVVQSLTPADNSTSVSVGDNLSIQFDQAVDVSTGNIVIKKSSDDSTVATITANSGQVTGGGTDTITINPSSDLSGSTEYYVQIDATAFESSGGMPYAGISDTTTWSFTTAETIPPNAPTSNVPAGTYSSTQTVSLSASDNIGGSGVDAIYYTTDGSTPDNTDTEYTVAISVSSSQTVKAIAYDNAGNTSTVASFAYVIDGSAPNAPGTPSTTSPTNDSTPTWTFTASSDSGDSGLANPAYTVQWSTLANFSDVNVATTATTNSTSYTSPALANGTWYLRVRAVDNASNVSSWSSAGSVVIDAVIPVLISTTPADNAVDVSIDGNLSFTLSEDISADTGNIVIKKSSDDSTVESIPVGSGQVNVSGSTVTINPGASFSEWTDYYIEIASTGFEDSVNNHYAGISDKTTWNFTTIGTKDITINNPDSSEPIKIETPSGSNLTCSSAVKEVEQESQDGSYTYPLGLVDFCFGTPNASNQVTLTFVTDLLPGQVVARKYNPNTQTYSDVTGAIITETTINGAHALAVTYTITDNGELDLDSDVGEIKDPIGLAIASAGTSDGSATAPNTGLQRVNSVLFVIAILTGMVTISTIIYANKRKKNKV